MQFTHEQCLQMFVAEHNGQMLEYAGAPFTAAVLVIAGKERHCSFFLNTNPVVVEIIIGPCPSDTQKFQELVQKQLQGEGDFSRCIGLDDDTLLFETELYVLPGTFSDLLSVWFSVTEQRVKAIDEMVDLLEGDEATVFNRAPLVSTMKH